MDIFTEAFTYNGDGTFTITEDALRKVFYKLHIAEAVASSSLRKYDDYSMAIREHAEWELDKVPNEEERAKLEEDMEYDRLEALADYSVEKLKSKS